MLRRAHPVVRQLAVLLVLLSGAVQPARAQGRTAYACSVQALRALDGDFPAFVRLVHPVRGLTYRESGRDLNDENVLSRAVLLANKAVSLIGTYAEPERDSTVRVREYLQRVVRAHPFRTTKDIRRNIRGLAHSTDLFQPARPGETLVSFHVTNPAQELDWYCLVVRTRVYRGAAYVTELDYLYWTP